MTRRVLIAGLGNMGVSHALAHHADPASDIVGLVNRSPRALPEALTTYPLFSDFKAALAETRPDIVVIATYSDSHADYACAAMRAGAHVFVEKPLATTVATQPASWTARKRPGANSWSVTSCGTTRAGGG